MEGWKKLQRGKVWFRVSADTTSDSEDEFAEHDFAAAAEKTTPRVEPPSPKTLARIRLDIDGTPLS